MKKTVNAVIIFCLLISLAGCSPYRSHYRAVGFVHSNVSNSAFMSFFEFDGTNVIKLKSKNAGEELKYSAKLETGEIKVYYDTGAEKNELITVSAGDEISSSLDMPATGKIYIIVETHGKCENGDLRFDIV